MSDEKKPQILKYIMSGLILAIALILIINLIRGCQFHGGLNFEEGVEFFAGHVELDSGEITIEEPLTSLQVSNIAGSIEILSSDNDLLKMEYKITGSANQSGNTKEPKISKTNSKITISRPDFPFKNVNLVYSFRVYIPGSVKSLKINSISGSITVGKLGSPIDQNLFAVSGSIRSESARNLEAHTTSGSIYFNALGDKVGVTTITGSIDGRLSENNAVQGAFNSISGSINLNLSKDRDYQFVFSSVSGQLTANPEPGNFKREKNKISGQYGQSGARIEAATVSGSISLSR
ncbi:MAG: DUF4097 family beta strand repeat protein [Spirochaetales bacterium]|nr:DUF4097 family beta strand repeat protein [Spirochaetales bacterium]